MTRRRQGGFTLTELMVVVVIFALMAAMATVSVTKGRGENQIDRFANQIRNYIVTARRRAVATGTTYLVDITPSTVQLCQIDPTGGGSPPAANSTQKECWSAGLPPYQAVLPATNPSAPPINCPSEGGPKSIVCENSAPYWVGNNGEATVYGYNPTVDLGGAGPSSTNFQHVQVYFFRDGTADFQAMGTCPPQAVPAPQTCGQSHLGQEAGLTLYLRGVSTALQSKHRKVVVYPASGRPRIIDQW